MKHKFVYLLMTLLLQGPLAAFADFAPRSSYGAISQEASQSPPVMLMQSAATANGAGTSLVTTGYATSLLSVQGSFSGTVNFEASVDGTNWVPILGTQVGTTSTATSTTSAGDFSFNVAGYSSIRARISSYATGSVTVKGFLSVVAGTSVPPATGTQPVSAASLPLPAGASTSAKQPALGTAGTPSSDVLTVQGAASMTPLKTDSSATTQPVSGTFWPATQPVSGTVAVTGSFWQATQPVSGTFWQTTQPINAAALPLPSNAAQETGGNLATVAGAVSSAKVNTQANASVMPSVVLLQSAAGANGNGTSLTTTGYATTILSVQGSFVGVVNFEASVDGTNWVSILGAQVGTVATTGTSTSSIGDWSFNCAGYNNLRARISGYVSGSVTVKGYVAVVGTKGGGSATTVANSDGNLTISPNAGAITANMATVANNTVKGNVSGSTAAPSNLTHAQLGGLINSGAPVFYASDYGVKADLKVNTVADGAITNGSHALTSTSSSFTAGDVGKTIVVSGAGASGVNLITTISAFNSSTSVTLTGTASTSVTASLVWVGTDDTTAWQSALNAASNGGVIYATGWSMIAGTPVSSMAGTSQLTIPYIAISAPFKTLRIQVQGLTKPEGFEYSLNYGSVAYVPTLAGCGLYSPISGGSGVSLLDSAGSGSVFNAVTFELDNFTLRAQNNPYVTLLNGSYVETLYVNDCVFDIDAYQPNLIQPTNYTSGVVGTVQAAIKCPLINSSGAYLRHIQILGQSVGVVVQENVHMDEVGCNLTYIGMFVCAMNHESYADRIGFAGCPYGIDFLHQSGDTGKSAFSVACLDVEHDQSSWYASQADVSDPNNISHGFINYATTLGGTGFDDNLIGWVQPTSPLTVKSLYSNKISGPPKEMQCRMYLVPGSPTADATNATTLSIGGFGGGNQIYLPDTTGNNYTSFQQTEITTAVPAQIYRLEDVFEYNNAGTVTVEIDPWDTTQGVSGTFTAVTAANPCVITATNSFSAGQLIGIAGITGTMGNAGNGLNGRVYKIASCNSTSITLEQNINTTGLTWSAGGIAYLVPTARSVGLTYQNGQYLRTGALNKVYIGTFMAGADGVSGQAQDNPSSRLSWSMYGRIPKFATAVDSGSSWTTTSTTNTPRNGTTALGISRNELIIGVAEDYISGSVSMCGGTTGGGYAVDTLLVNTITATSSSNALAVSGLFNNGVGIGNPSNQNSMIPPIGYSFTLVTDRVSGGTGTFYGTTGGNGGPIVAGTSFVYGRF